MSIEMVDCIPEFDGCHVSTTHDKAEFVGILLGVAALDQMVPPISDGFMADESIRYSCQIDLHWRVLVLFKSVTLYACTHSIELPEPIKNVRRSWERSVLRSVSQKHESKDSRRKILNQVAKVIRQKQNPFGEEDPEKRDFLKYAFEFTHCDNTKHQNRDSLRKDVRESIAAYARSINTFGLALKESQENPID